MAAAGTGIDKTQWFADSLRTSFTSASSVFAWVTDSSGFTSPASVMMPCHTPSSIRVLVSFNVVIRYILKLRAGAPRKCQIA